MHHLRLLNWKKSIQQLVENQKKTKTTRKQHLLQPMNYSRAEEDIVHYLHTSLMYR